MGLYWPGEQGREERSESGQRAAGELHCERFSCLPRLPPSTGPNECKIPNQDESPKVVHLRATFGQILPPPEKNDRVPSARPLGLGHAQFMCFILVKGKAELLSFYSTQTFAHSPRYLYQAPA